MHEISLIFAADRLGRELRRAVNDAGTDWEVTWSRDGTSVRRGTVADHDPG